MVSVDQWPAAIGTFNCHKRVTRSVSFSDNVNTSHFLSIILYYLVNGATIIILAFLYIFIFLLGHGDIESNPGSKRLKLNYVLFVIGTSTAFLLINSQKSHNLKHSIPSINMTLSYYVKHT